MDMAVPGHLLMDKAPMSKECKSISRGVKWGKKLRKKSKAVKAGRQKSREAMADHQKQLGRGVKSCQQGNTTPFRKNDTESEAIS